MRRLALLGVVATFVIASPGLSHAGQTDLDCAVGGDCPGQGQNQVETVPEDLDPAAALECPSELPGPIAASLANDAFGDSEPLRVHPDSRFLRCYYYVPGAVDVASSGGITVEWDVVPTADCPVRPPLGGPPYYVAANGVLLLSSSHSAYAVYAGNEPIMPGLRLVASGLVRAADAEAVRCDASATAGGGSTDQGAEPASSHSGGGIPTDAEILIAAGLIMSLLGGVTTFANLPSRLRRVNRELAEDVFVADAEGSDLTPLPPPERKVPWRVRRTNAPGDFNQTVFEDLTSVPLPEPPPPPSAPSPVDDEYLPTKAPDKHFQPGDLNHPLNQQPTVGHDQFVDWLHNVEAVNPGKTWQQITTAVHNSLYMGVDAHDTFPVIGVPLFVDGPATDGWQDVRFPTKKVPQWVLDPQGRKVDLGHVMAGIRSDFNRMPGRSREMEQWGNTDGGDLWQVVMEPFVATLDGIWHQHVPHYVDRAPPDQLRGNQVSLSVRSFYRDPANAHAPLSKYFEEQFSEPSP